MPLQTMTVVTTTEMMKKMATDICSVSARNETRNSDFAVHRAYLKVETAKGRENFSYVELKQYLLKVCELHGKVPLWPCVT
jgi:hypothetical protein